MKNFRISMLLLVAFAIWTLMVVTVDVQAAGPQGSSVGFADFNCWFHQLTEVLEIIKE